MNTAPAPSSTQQHFTSPSVQSSHRQSGDNVRFLARSFNVPGDHLGQVSTGYRWPYGPVAIVSPFNFPLEIPMLQMMGALYMGNKVVFKTDSKVSVVMEQTIRLLHHCGMPMEDMDFINCDGSVMHGLLMSTRPRVTQFNGSSKVAEILAKELHGKVKIEDAGFDWKILGPDVRDEDYVAYTCDQDAYAYRCTKASMMPSSALKRVEATFIAAAKKMLTVGAQARTLDEDLVPQQTTSSTPCGRAARMLAWHRGIDE